MRAFRHKTLFSISMVVLLAGIAACGESPSATNSDDTAKSSETIELVYWNFDSHLQDNAELFNKTHPGIHVTSVRKSSSDNSYYPALQTAIKAGNAPDIALVEYQLMPTLLAVKGLVDISQYGANDVKSQFPAWTWAQVSQGSGVYGIPQDVGPMALYYRPDIFKAAGIDHPPATWEEYADDAAKIHAANPNNYISTFNPDNPGWVTALIWQGGGQWFSTNGTNWTVNINDANSKKVINFWNNLISKGLVKTIPDFSTDWNNDLKNGAISSWVSAVWGQGVLSSNAPDTKGKWAVASLPQWSTSSSVSAAWGGSATSVTTSSKHPKEAAEFAKWLNTNRESVALEVTGYGIYPAASFGADLPEVNKANDFFGGQKTSEIFAAASKNIDTKWTWGPTMVNLMKSQSQLMTDAVSKKTSLSDALDALQKSVIQDMKSNQISVSGS
jgi:multiple sugar transport system substrate-binding protein